MQSAPSGSIGVSGRRAGHERRSRYRRPLHTLAYVTLSSENGGILRDVSDHGASLHTVAPLRVGQPVSMRFDLFSAGSTPSRLRLEAEGQVAWVGNAGQAGVQFTNVAPATRRQLNEWVMGSLLASIAQASPMLNAAGLEDAGENLLLSAAARPAIAVPVTLATSTGAASDEDLLLDWVLTRISPNTLQALVDGLVLLAAVLLFLVIALAVTKAIPDWRVTTLFTLGVLAFAALLYRGLASFFGIPTAGRWLGHIAERQWQSTHEAPETRFR